MCCQYFEMTYLFIRASKVYMNAMSPLFYAPLHCIHIYFRGPDEEIGHLEILATHRIQSQKPTMSFHVIILADVIREMR